MVRKWHILLNKHLAWFVWHEPNFKKICYPVYFIILMLLSAFTVMRSYFTCVIHIKQVICYSAYSFIQLLCGDIMESCNLEHRPQIFFLLFSVLNISFSFFIQMVERVFEDAGNIFENIITNIITNSNKWSGFFKNRMGFIFQKNRHVAL